MQVVDANGNMFGYDSITVAGPDGRPKTLSSAIKLITLVRNTSGSTMTKGTVVYINGGSGNKPTIARALATSDATSAQTYGVVQSNIPNNKNGYVVVIGALDGVNTSAYAPGTQLYLSSTVAGEWTSTKQLAPAHLVYVGIVVRQHVNQGVVEVKIQNGYELDEIHDVSITTPLNNQVLQYESSTQLWKNKTLATGITIGSTAIASGVVGRVLFEGAGNVVQESANFFWDNTGFLGIGTSTPVAPSTYNGITINSATAGSYVWFQTGGVTKYSVGSEGNVNYHNLVAGTSFLIRSGGSSYFNVVQSTGNVQIGTTTDAGFKLDVNGSTRVTSLRTADIFPASANISLWVNSLNASSRFYTAPVHQDGRINFNAIAGGSDQVLIRAWHTGMFGLGTGSSAAGGALTVRGDSLLIGTSGSLFFMNGTFGPLNVPYRLGISTSATTAAFYSGVGNNQTNIESTKFEFTATSHTFYTGTTTGNQSNPNQFIPLHLSNIGNIIVGSTTDPLNTKVTISGNITASSGISRGANITNTIIAAANNDVLVGLDITPTYTNGAFTGLANIDLRTKGTGLVIGSGVGYGALYGYNNDGIIQVVDGGTSAITGFSYATQLWLRPSGNAAGLNSNYWATIEQSTGGLYIQSGRYNSNLFLRTGRTGTSGNIYFNNAGGTMAMLFGATGNFAVATTTDSGFKFSVNGSILCTTVAEIQSTSGLRLRTTSAGASVQFAAANTNKAEIKTNDGSVLATTFNQSGVVGFSTQVSFGGTDISNVSAQVEINSTTRGFLPPRMTTTQKNAIATPAAGLMVYDTDLTRPCFYDGTTWITL